MTQQSPACAAARASAPKKPGRPVAYTPNVVPLIDVLFLLLLFFLLSTTFRQDELDIAASLPGGGDGEHITLVLNIRPTGDNMRPGATYDLQRSAVSLNSPAELYEKLRQTKARFPRGDVQLTIRPREDVRWAFVVEAYNQARRANFSGIAFERP
jgi:biopolymer transport protein ExbD